MDEQERKEFIRKTLKETLAAMPDFDVGFDAVIQHLQSGKTKTGCSLLIELLEVENKISKFLFVISRDLGPAYFEIRAEGKSPIEVRETWLLSLEKLRNGVRDKDWSLTGDLLAAEIPAGIQKTKHVLEGALALV